MKDMSVKELNEQDMDEAIALVQRVFMEFEAPDYTQEGIDEFLRSVRDEVFIDKLRFYGAFISDELIGVIATGNEGSHIALFFVDKKYQKQGIGHRLFETAKKNCHHSRMTVNSSPYAVAFYHRLGFTDADSEQTVNGLRFTPMELDMKK